MKKYFKYFIFMFFTLIKFSIIKLFHWKKFSFYPLEIFSLNTETTVEKGAKLKIGKMVRAQSNVRIRSRKNAELLIGDNVSFNYGCIVTAHHNIKIGKDSQFGPNVLVYDHDHDFRAEGGLKGKKFKCSSVEIGESCWIGANTIILRGTKLGDGCVVGAGSVLKGVYEPNSIIVQKKETVVQKY